MALSISDHFTYPKLLRFTFPSVVMMVFMSLYTIVDGFFVSNLAGKDAFTSLNLIWPAVGLLGAFGFMFGTGGTALVSKTLGEQKKELACEYFTMIIVFEIILAIVVSAITIACIIPICHLVGATEDLIPGCIAYGVPLLAIQVFMYLSHSYQSFLVVVGKAKFGLVITLITGFSNMILDYVLIGVFNMSVLGAALATGVNWIIGALIPTWWFWKHQEADLHFTKFKWRFKALAQASFNGLSEMVSNISMNLIVLLYNVVLMKMAGPDGVVVYGVIQYLSFLFAAVFLGYSMAIAPCIGYQYGAQNRKELKNLLIKSLVIITVVAVGTVLLASLGANQLSAIFVSYSDELMEMCETAIRIYCIGFLMAGFNIFASGFFTALNNGPVSAILSLLRTFVFQVGAILIMPQLFGLNGVWSATVVAEALSLVVSLAFILGLRKRYGYL